MGVCNCSMFCCTLLYVHSSIAIILMGKRELIALLNLSSWCLVMVERLFLAVPRGCLQFVIVVFPDHTHLLLFMLCLLCLMRIITVSVIRYTGYLNITKDRIYLLLLLSNNYIMGCPPVRGDNPRALASKHGITILYHLHQCRPCI